MRGVWARAFVHGTSGRVALAALLLLATLVGALGSPTPAAAAGFVVTTGNDTLDAAGGLCSNMTPISLPGPDNVTSLREAICAANSNADADTITFASGVNEVTLDSMLPFIGKSLTIQGRDTGGVTIQRSTTATSNFRILTVYNGTASFVEVTLIGLTLKDGRVGGAESGGSLANGGVALTMADSVITGGVVTGSGHGGGYYQLSGSQLTSAAFHRTTISNNTVAGSNGSPGNPSDPGGDASGGGLYIAGGTVDLIDSTVRDNKATGGNGGDGGNGSNGGDGGNASGGGLYVSGTDTRVTLVTSTVSGNTAQGGNGGGSNYNCGSGGTATGGGEFVASGGTVELTSSTLSGNTAQGGPGGGGNDKSGGGGNAIGGGVAASDTDTRVTLTSSTVSGNIALGGPGGNGFGGGRGGTATGGGATIAGGGIVELTSSTVSGNTAQGGNGGVSFTYGTGDGGAAIGGGVAVSGTATMVTLVNSTVSGNTAQGGPGGPGGTGGSNGGASGGSSAGGGVFVSGMVTLMNSTVSGNTAQGGPGGPGRNGSPDGNGGVATGGGLAVAAFATLQLSGTIIAASTGATTCSNNSIQPGTITDNGYNLETADSCSFRTAITTPSGTSLVNTDPLLTPLANNGGDTLTHLPDATSPARDRIPSGHTACPTAPTTDQRGFTRPQGTHCDIGAVEARVYTLTTSAASGTVGGAVTLSARLTSNGNIVQGFSVIFTLNDTPAGTATTDSNGVATLPSVSLGSIAAGSYPTGVGASVTANIDTPTSTTAQLTVTKAPQTITFPALTPASRPLSDGSFTVSATATSALAVSFTAGPPAVCTADTTTGSTITLVGAGTCTITAHQGGNTTYLAAPDVGQTLTVTVAPNPTVQLTIPTSGSGSVSRSPAGSGSGPFSYDVGTLVTLTPQPADGQTFTGWLVDGVNQGWANPLTITMDTAHTVQATFAPTVSFPDVGSGRQDFPAITALASRGTIQGYQTGQYGPDDKVTRAQMAALIARATPLGPGTPTLGTLVPPACLKVGSWDCENWGNSFSDRGSTDPNLWRNAGTLQHYGVSLGYTGTACKAKKVASPCYGPSDDVTYAQTISFITRAMKAKGYWVDQPGAPLPYSNVPAAHQDDVRTFHFYTSGLTGVPSAPNTAAGWNAGATRGWFARALWTALDSYWQVDRVP